MRSVPDDLLLSPLIPQIAGVTQNKGWEEALESIMSIGGLTSNPSCRSPCQLSRGVRNETADGSLASFLIDSVFPIWSGPEYLLGRDVDRWSVLIEAGVGLKGNECKGRWGEVDCKKARLVEMRDEFLIGLSK
ncbi:hypothetical protein NPIL_95041 [Nephila pilipes]|uniref:Uncharacterized protein n=1 Tax=Nephila pilipes TaxID=299642 RepID=A0A8X6MXG9_NEPPI|nr:hypothetical protein NPIL_95041 [Nephila pilipes]